ncbi:MAG: hypothetical protein OXH40_06920 [Chloroflexi bacterium]|nr:hypothetical protein [Chloroflexota bacterium]
MCTTNVCRPPLYCDLPGRRKLRTRLDALFFPVYDLSEDDTSYIRHQFPALDAGATDPVIPDSAYNENI